MTKLLIGVLSLALVGTGGLVAAVGGFDGEAARAVSIPAASTARETTDGGATMTGATTTGTTTTGSTTTGATPTGGTTTGGDDDLSGPCDEAEHANDPRCTGAGGGGDDHDDRDDDDHGDRDDDDRSGSNSGRG